MSKYRIVDFVWFWWMFLSAFFFCHFAKTHSTHSTEKCLMCLPWNLNQSTYKLRFQLVHLRCITNNLINVHIQIFLVIFIFFDVIQFHFFCLRRIEWLQTESFFLSLRVSVYLNLFVLCILSLSMFMYYYLPKWNRFEEIIKIYFQLERKRQRYFHVHTCINFNLD